jgi:hypothetical protein
MLAMHAAHAGLGGGAHAVHYAIAGVGILGLVALLTPHLLTAPSSPDGHEARAPSLRSAPPDPSRAGLAAGSLSATALDPTQVASRESWLLRAPALTAAQRALLPLAVVSSASAAGVHAAVAPAHLGESLLFGCFFVVLALLQLLWAAAVAVRGSRPLLAAGAVGNVAVVGLWATTRTLGLPFALLPRPEAVGAWDLAGTGWELVVVVTCVGVLRSRDHLPERLVSWRSWHPALPTYVAASAFLLVALSLSGAAS